MQTYILSGLLSAADTSYLHFFLYASCNKVVMSLALCKLVPCSGMPLFNPSFKVLGLVHDQTCFRYALRKLDVKYRGNSFVFISICRLSWLIRISKEIVWVTL